MISCWKHKNFGIIGIVLKYLIVKPVRTGKKFLIKTSTLEFSFLWPLNKFVPTTFSHFPLHYFCAIRKRVFFYHNEYCATKSIRGCQIDDTGPQSFLKSPTFTNLTCQLVFKVIWVPYYSVNQLAQQSHKFEASLKYEIVDLTPPNVHFIFLKKTN